MMTLPQVIKWLVGVGVKSSFVDFAAKQENPAFENHGDVDYIIHAFKFSLRRLCKSKRTAVLIAITLFSTSDRSLATSPSEKHIVMGLILPDCKRLGIRSLQ